METTPTTPVTRTRKVRVKPDAEPKQRAKLTAKSAKTAEPVMATPKPRKRSVIVQDTVPVTIKKRTSKRTATQVDALVDTLVDSPVDSEVLISMISVAAYYLAERRGFAPGGEVQDWLIAEQQIHLRRQR